MAKVQPSKPANHTKNSTRKANISEGNSVPSFMHENGNGPEATKSLDKNSTRHTLQQEKAGDYTPLGDERISEPGLSYLGFDTLMQNLVGEEPQRPDEGPIKMSLPKALPTAQENLSPITKPTNKWKRKARVVGIKPIEGLLRLSPKFLGHMRSKLNGEEAPLWDTKRRIELRDAREDADRLDDTVSTEAVQ